LYVPVNGLSVAASLAIAYKSGERILNHSSLETFSFAVSVLE